jgi:hypothetical protein
MELVIPDGTFLESASAVTPLQTVTRRLRTCMLPSSGRRYAYTSRRGPTTQRQFNTLHFRKGFGHIRFTHVMSEHSRNSSINSACTQRITCVLWGAELQFGLMYY